MRLTKHLTCNYLKQTCASLTKIGIIIKNINSALSLFSLEFRLNIYSETVLCDIIGRMWWRLFLFCCCFHQKYKRGDGETHELFFNLIEHLLEYEPDRRLSAKEAICHPFFYGMIIHSSVNRHSHSKSRWLLTRKNTNTRAYFARTLFYYALLFIFLLFSFATSM